MGGRHQYDEQLLVDLLVEGELTLTEIARRVGVTAATVSSVARGRTRRDLYKEICRRRGPTQQDKAMHTGADYIRPLLLTQLKVAMSEKGETARKCREFLLSKLLFTGRSARGASPEARGEDTEQAETLADIQRELAEITGLGLEDQDEPDAEA